MTKRKLVPLMKDTNYISIDAKIYKNVSLESPVRVYGTAKVQEDSSVKSFTLLNTHTTIAPKTSIGRYCSIGKLCHIGVIAHPIEWLSSSPVQYNMAYHFPDFSNKFPNKEFERPMETVIGNDVWVDAASLVLRGVRIGDGAVIKARTVVTKDVPPYAIVEGVPGKIIAYRFDNKIIRKLLDLQWWDMEYRELSQIQFDDIHKAIEQIESIKKEKKIKKPKEVADGD